MSTNIHSDKRVGVRPRWWALGIDNKDCWHNVRARRDGSDEIVVVAADGTLLHRRRLGRGGVDAWIQAIDAEEGWQDHPDASPGRGWLEAVTA